MSHVLASSNKTSSSEKNDTKIIEFGWVILIIYIANFLKPILFHLLELKVKKLTPCGHPCILCFVYTDHWPTMGFPKTEYG